MKKIYTLIIAALTVILTGCGVNDTTHFDTTPPAPPTGIQVLNGDNRVDIYWNHNSEPDVAGYNVYYSKSYDGKYTLIGSTTNNSFADLDAVNGNTYYYAVTAYDYNNNESELSKDAAYSTPRPEGMNQSIFDYRKYPDNAGYSFNTYTPVAYDSKDADFFYEYYNGTYYLDVWDDSDIQDMGATNDIYDIDYAPSSGWSSTKDELVVPGHTYVIWTWDNHYAKVRVSSLTRDRMVFDWAFQLQTGNRQLKTSGVKTTRGELVRKALRP